MTATAFADSEQQSLQSIHGPTGVMQPSKSGQNFVSTDGHRVRRNAVPRFGPPRLIPASRPVYVGRPVLRPLPPRPYPTRPGTRIPYLPFFRVMGAPVSPSLAAGDGKQRTEKDGVEDATESPGAGRTISKKVQVESGLDNKSEAEVEVLPVTLVVDMDVLATGVLDLVNTLEESGLLPDDDEAQEFRTALQSAKEGERQVFEVDPSSMNVIFAEIMKSHLKQE